MWCIMCWNKKKLLLIKRLGVCRENTYKDRHIMKSLSYFVKKDSNVEIGGEEVCSFEVWINFVFY